MKIASQTNSNGNSYYYPFITSSWDAYGHFTGLPDEDLWAFGWADVIPPQWIYHYWANNVQQHLVSGSWAADIAVTARTTMKLFTGGKATIQRRNLIQLQCGAEAYGTALPSDQWGPVFAEWAGVPKTPIAAAKLRALGQWVGSDGNLWLALPDNEALTLNLSAPAQHYNAWATPTKYPVTITANGNDLSVTNPEFCVGQKVTFSLNNLPTGNIVNMIGNWQLPARFVNVAWQNQIFVPTPPVGGYYISSGSVNYRTNSSLLENTNQTSCWFVNGSGGTVGMNLNFQFNNGQYVNVTAKGDFTVFRPSVMMNQVNGPRYYTINDDIGLTCKLKLGENNGSGDGTMRYSVEVDSKPAGTHPFDNQFYGNVGITQLITADYSNPVLIFSDERCDGSEFYSPPIRIIHSCLPGLNDGPSDIWTTPNIVNLSCRDFIRFKPDGDDSIWVTLGIVTWDTVGTAEQDFWGNWTKTTDVTPAPSGPDRLDTFPIWTQSVTAH